MDGALEAESEIFENSPIIIKDKYTVSGSDMAQIGWVEVTTENGASGYSLHDGPLQGAKFGFVDGDGHDHAPL